MASQCHSSWRLFHLSLLPGQITYYIIVHLISKDMLMTPLNKDEKSCSGILLAPKHVSLLHVYVCAPTSVCHKFANNGPPTLKPSQTLLHFSIIPSPGNLSSFHFVSTVNSSSVCTEWQWSHLWGIMCPWNSTKFKVPISQKCIFYCPWLKKTNTSLI